MKFSILLSTLAIAAAGTVNAHADNPFCKPEKQMYFRNTLNPKFTQNKVRKAAELPQGAVLYEDFEEWDGTVAWAPEGWTCDHKVMPAGHPGWRAYGYDPLDPINYPSTSYIFYKFEEPVDEWLISPEFTVGEGMIFQADCYNAGSYYYDIDAEMFTSNIYSIEKVNDFIINITTDDGKTWTPLYSIPDEMSKLGYTKAYEYWDRSGWETIQLSLDGYVGKTAKIAFQIVGNPVGMPNDPTSQSSGVDNIFVGMPRVDVSYQRPVPALFYGFTSDDNITAGAFSYLPGTFMVVPVYSPVKFKNTSKTFGAEYSWSADHTDGTFTSDNQSELVITYGTNYESESTTRNNIYEMPVLTGDGETFTRTQFALSGYIQAGGRGEYEAKYQDGTSKWIQYGLAVADPHSESSRTYADFTVPYFGYNAESDRYWTSKEFGITINDYDQKFKDDDNNWCHLTKYGNIFYTSDAPIVIEGIRTNGYGRGTGANGFMTPNAKFTAEIYYLEEDLKVPDKPTYTIDCTGNDITVIDRYASNHLIALNFKPESPIVISREDCTAILVAITGFHDSENIDYFSPEMSELDNPDGLSLGWYCTETRWGGYDLPASWKPVYEHTKITERIGEQLISFFIMLDGYYPWLVGDTETITLQPGETANLTLDSYYDGSQLTIEGLPAWLKATATGQYDKTNILFTADATASGYANVTISAPGVKKTLLVGNTPSGINDITAESTDGKAEYFNLQGVKIDQPQKGQLVIKRQGTTTSKVIFK